MKRRNPPNCTPSTELLLPQPSAEGIARVRELYLNRAGKRITDEQARDVLFRIMRFQYLNLVTNAPVCSGMPYTPENQTTTGE